MKKVVSLLVLMLFVATSSGCRLFKHHKKNHDFHAGEDTGLLHPEPNPEYGDDDEDEEQPKKKSEDGKKDEGKGDKGSGGGGSGSAGAQ